MYVTRGQEARSVEMLPGVRRTLLSTQERLMLLQFEILKGTVVPEHSHAAEQAGYVLEGRFEVVIGGQQYMLSPGDSYFIPSNVAHSGFVHEDVKFLDIYSPPRPEYLG